MPHDRTFRFGIIANATRTAVGFAEFARRVEDLGYSTFFMPDHFVDHALAPIPGIAAAAAATTTLRIGTLVLGNDYRGPPVVLANEAATIDVLSDGRLERGLGAGWMTADYEQGGFGLDPASTRIARLDESLRVIKGLMADGPFTFTGEHYAIAGLDGEPKPLQRPHPAIIVGGGGPKILAVAAEHAQIVGINASLKAGEGTHPDTDDRDSIAAGIASHFGVDPAVALETPAVLVGTVDQMCEDLLARRERRQMSYVVVSEEFADVFAPVVARLAGT